MECCEQFATWIFWFLLGWFSAKAVIAGIAFIRSSR